ncbi:MAG: helix-turn-helix domain-containing protein [Actinomycetota bacterium]|nr:helix-turn-helix domain-containing protein [Actinomycetota bacterium]
MPERSFGRTIRYRRTKLGLSQAKLGELVGRSASTIRAWERDSSLPNDESVITALSAVLAVDRQSLFEKAGLEVPLQQTSPTLEEAFASLGSEPRSTPVVADQPFVPLPLGAETEPPIPSLSAPEAEAVQIVEIPDESDEGDREWEPDEEPYPVWEPKFPDEALFKATPLVSRVMKPSVPAPAFVEPPDPFVRGAATPPLVEPSYMEDTAQRQLYRVRSLATLVLLVGMGIVLLWALSSTFDALGSWWEDFIGTLRL